MLTCLFPDYNLEDFHINKSLSNEWCNTKKSQEAHSQAFNKDFNATDLLFNSPVCELCVSALFFPVSASVASKRLLWTNKQKISMTTDDETWNWSEVQKHTCYYWMLP